MADNKSSLVQIAQDVLDVPTQSIKTTLTVDGESVSDTNPLPVAIDGASVTVDVALNKDNDSVTAWQGGGAWSVSNPYITQAVATSAKQDLLLAETQSVDTHVEKLTNVYDSLSQSLKVSVVSGGGGGGGDVNLAGEVSAANSSVTPLGANAVFTGASFDAKDFATLSISVKSDQSSAIDGISVQFSQDGTNWDHIHTYTYTLGSNGLSYNLPVEMRYVRIVYTNGAIAQTSFRLQSLFRRTQVPPSVYTIDQGLYDSTIGTPTKSVIFGKTTGGGGGYVAVKVNPSGALTTEVTGTVTVAGVATAANQTSQITELQAIKANTARLNYIGRIRLAYTSTNVTTGAWVELLASVGVTAVKEIEIFDSSGETLELGIGASGSEISKSYVFPGGNGRIPMQIAATSRLAIKAVSATANSGEIIINLYG